MIRYTKAYIKDQLDKYMDGTSTLEEEDILTNYFRTQNVPHEWEDYRQLFQEIEAMKPQPKTSKRWIGWSVAAAIVAGIVYITIPSSHREDPKPLIAETDTTVIQQTEKVSTEVNPDIKPQQLDQVQPVQTKKRRIRKAEPTIHDIDKAYAVMAKAEQEQQEVEQMMAQCQQEIIEAQLAAYGFIPVKQEDGTIIYINEQINDIAYEE